MQKIRINSNLKRDSRKDPTKDRVTKNIGSLINMIMNNELVLPIFQTDIRWKTVHALALLNFQLQGNAPVAPISFNRITIANPDMVNITFLDRKVITFSEMLGTDKFNVVDGQQRLTCNYKAATNHDDFKSIVLDIGKGKFIDIKSETIKYNQIPVGILYNKNFSCLEDYLEKTKITDFKVMQLLNQVRTKFLNYDYIINNAKDLSFDEQIEWFNVLNSAGSNVPDVQMKLTNLQVKGIDFYADYSRVFRDKLDAEFEGILNIKTTEVSIPLACLNPSYKVIHSEEHAPNFSPIPSDQKIKEICSSDTTEIREYFTTTLAALDNSIEFIKENNLSNPNRIDYITYLVGFFVWNRDKDISEEKKENLKNWYNTVSFANMSNGSRRNEFVKIVNIANS